MSLLILASLSTDEKITIAALVVAVVAIVVAVWAAPWRRARAKIDALVDPTGFVDVKVTNGKATITITKVQLVVPEVTSHHPKHGIVIDAVSTFKIPETLSGQSTGSWQFQLPTEPQLLPTGSPPEMIRRVPTMNEVWVRVDFRRKRHQFKQPVISPTPIEA